MKPSTDAEVQKFYDETASGYAQMMDGEIDLPLYADVLGRLAQRLEGLTGPVVDTSCGSGHMLERYREKFDDKRPQVGVDLSPRMVELARNRLGGGAELHVGDMRELEGLADGSAAALISFFALHHVSAQDARRALANWHRVLCRGGQLLVATWEGIGPIDYGEHADIIALRYSKDELTEWARGAGFVVDRATVEPVEEIPMDAVYLEATRP